MVQVIEQWLSTPRDHSGGRVHYQACNAMSQLEMEIHFGSLPAWRMDCLGWSCMQYLNRIGFNLDTSALPSYMLTGEFNPFQIDDTLSTYIIYYHIYTWQLYSPCYCRQKLHEHKWTEHVLLASEWWSLLHATCQGAWHCSPKAGQLKTMQLSCQDWLWWWWGNHTVNMVVFHSHRLVDYLHIWTKGISELMSMAPMEARIMCLETIILPLFGTPPMHHD